MITELFLPTKGGTAVSFDDDFRRLGGKEVHIVTADVPGAAEFEFGTRFILGAESVLYKLGGQPMLLVCFKGCQSSGS